MRPINEAISLPPDNQVGAPNDSTDKPQEARDQPPKMYIPEQKTPPSKQTELSKTLGSVPGTGDSPTLSSSNPVVLPRGQAPVSESTSSVSKAEENVIPIELENHVSLQIFSTEETKKNKNAVLFLHGGPDLLFGEDYENLKSWSLEHGYTLIAPEIAGSEKQGLKNTSDSFSDPPNYVRDLKSVLHYLRQHADFKEKEICIVAHSWGGFQLASFLTDKNLSPEDRNFIKQIVFMSPNLDSAHTRIYEMSERIGGPTFETELRSEMIRRHAGSESNSTEKLSFVNNPVMDKDLNEKISPFYRLDQMPKDIPCLFIHPTSDKTVPVSQSLAAVEKINSSGGNAKIFLATSGGHAFFTTKEVNDPLVTTACFGAIDNLIKHPDSLNTATIDGEPLENSTTENIEAKIKEKDNGYENLTKLLDEWHGQAETTKGRKSKIQALTEEVRRKESLLKIFEDRKLTGHASYKINSDSLSMIKKFLENL